jgi:tetratricopeptide (TPR) repeat protein
VCACAAAVGGCGGGSGQTVEIRYERPARKEIPARIRALAITPFEGKTREEKKWGSVAADKLAALLHEYNRRYKRYRLVDRTGLKKIMDERRLQLALSDPSTAPKLAKLARVDALTYGRVVVAARTEPYTRRVFDPFSRGFKSVRDYRRNVNVNMTFRIIDTTSKTVIALAATRNYDSEKTKRTTGKKIGRFIGVTGSDLSATDQVINDLITECVDEIVDTISPHEEVVREELEKGFTEHVKTGNALAVTGEYREALDCYLSGIEAKPDDHGAMFNAGLMYEAMGDLAKAAELYNRAFRHDPKKRPKYAQARRRVRGETKH